MSKDDDLFENINDKVKKSIDHKTGAINGLNFSSNYCDVKKGPCACGAWH
jgi:hypothetical protein